MATHMRASFIVKDMTGSVSLITFFDKRVCSCAITPKLCSSFGFLFFFFLPKVNFCKLQLVGVTQEPSG